MLLHIRNGRVVTFGELVAEASRRNEELHRMMDRSTGPIAMPIDESGCRSIAKYIWGDSPEFEAYEKTERKE